MSSIELILEIVTLVFVVVGGLFGLYQWYHSNRIKRSEFMLQIMEKLRFDELIVETMYMFEYKSGWYSSDFHNSALESSVDQTLSLINHICYLKFSKILKDSEFKALRYEVSRTCHSKDVENYLWNLYHFSNKFDMPASFDYLINFGLENKFFDADFKNYESKKYVKTLNF
jgi:hypothetical protein